jgi:regulator of nucleoside diphosphate kinase
MQTLAPPIVLHGQDFNNLVLLTSIAAPQALPYAQFLLAELRRAELCAVERMPQGVVTMGARVTYRIAAIVQVRTLVFPGEVNLVEGALSIATAKGIALLGLRAGDRMPFPTADGRSSELAVLHVEEDHQRCENAAEALDRRLDHALEETFPASDPVSIICTARET